MLATIAAIQARHAHSADGPIIAGGEPGMKVSWQVTGIRQDTWANANRMAVEVDKPTATSP